MMERIMEQRYIVSLYRNVTMSYAPPIANICSERKRDRKSLLQSFISSFYNYCRVKTFIWNTKPRKRCHSVVVLLLLILKMTNEYTEICTSFKIVHLGHYHGNFPYLQHKLEWNVHSKICSRYWMQKQIS
jgi:hypothetical protein